LKEVYSVVHSRVWTRGAGGTGGRGSAGWAHSGARSETVQMGRGRTGEATKRGSEKVWIARQLDGETTMTTERIMKRLSMRRVGYMASAYATWGREAEINMTKCWTDPGPTPLRACVWRLSLDLTKRKERFGANI